MRIAVLAREDKSESYQSHRGFVVWSRGDAARTGGVGRRIGGWMPRRIGDTRGKWSRPDSARGSTVLSWDRVDWRAHAIQLTDDIEDGGLEVTVTVKLIQRQRGAALVGV